MLTWKRTRHPIGIDVGAYGVRMLQLDACVAEPQIPRVVAAARMAWPDDVRAKFDTGKSPPIDVVAPLIAQLANRGQFRGRDVAITLPRELVRLKTLRLPAMPPDDAIAAATLDARVMFEAAEGEHNVQVFPAGEVRQGNETKLEMIAAAVPIAEVDAIVERWHAAGFRPASIDIEPIAIYRSVERFVRRRDDEAEVNVLVEIGARRTIVLIGRGRELSFYKAIETGGAMFTRAIARKLALDVSDTVVLRQRLAATHDPTRVISDDPVRQAVVDGVRPIVEEIAREISLCLRYFSVNFRGNRPLRVRLVGGEASDPTIVLLLEKALPVPVEVGRPIVNADCSAMPCAEREGALSDWTHAFGLALKFSRGPFADRTGPSRASVAAAAATAAAPTGGEPGRFVIAAPDEMSPASVSLEVSRA